MRWRCYCDLRVGPRGLPRPGGAHPPDPRASASSSRLWEHPYISVESALFEDGRRKGYFVLRPDGTVYVIDYGLSLAPRPDGRVRLAGPRETWNAPVAIIDFTNPAARAWFQDLHRPLFRMGVDAFKTDFGEDIPEDARFHDGRTGREMHNLYPLLYNDAVFEVTAEEKGRGLVWSRSATAGSQRYPVGWSGDPASDWASLAATIRGGLSAGMSGLSLWSHDIGGYRGIARSRALRPLGPVRPLLVAQPYARRLAPRAVAVRGRGAGHRPRVRPPAVPALPVHPERGPGGPRHGPARPPCPAPGLPGRPERRGLGPRIHVRAVAPRRAGHPSVDGASTGGRRAECTEETGLSPRGTASLAGRGAPRFPVYLPPGDWFDFWTGRLFVGPAVVEAAARLDILPLFVRAGAIVPMTRAGRADPRGPRRSSGARALSPRLLVVHADRRGGPHGIPPRAGEARLHPGVVGSGRPEVRRPLRTRPADGKDRCPVIEPFWPGPQDPAASALPAPLTSR